MRYIGIDTGTQCGYAVVDAHGVRLDSGIWHFGLKPDERDGQRLARFIHASRALIASQQEHDRCCVGYEKAYPITPVTAALAGAFEGCLQVVCEQLRVPIRPIAPMSIKKHALSGRATKAQMVEAANRRWNREIRIDYREGQFDKLMQPKPPTFPGGGDNEADALWTADALRAGIGA